MSFRFVFLIVAGLILLLVLVGAASRGSSRRSGSSSTRESHFVTPPTEEFASVAPTEESEYVDTWWEEEEDAGSHSQLDDTLVFNGHIDEHAQLDTYWDPDITLAQFFHDRYRVGIIGTWIKPEHNPTGRNVIMELMIKSHYSLYIEDDCLKLGMMTYEADEEATAAEEDSDEVKGSGYRVYSYSFDLTKSDWTFLMLVANLSTPNAVPMLFTKGLDKTTVPQQVYYNSVRRIESGRPTHVTRITDKVMIGPGFKGSITPLTIQRFDHHFTSHDILNLRYCLEDHLLSQCTSDSSNQLTDVIYQLKGPRGESSIRRETNAVRLYYYSYLQCHDFGVSIGINPAGFDLAIPERVAVREYHYNYYDDGRQYEYYSETYTSTNLVNLTVGEHAGGMACNFRWDEDVNMYRISNIKLSDCGFASTNLGNETFYQNSVYHQTDSDSRKIISISCKYTPRPATREEITVKAYVIEKMSLTADITYTSVRMSLGLFSDRFYSKELANPAKLGEVDEVIYVEVKANTNDTSVVLEVESCRTHVTLNKHDTLQTKLIDNFQPTNPSVTFIDSESSLTIKKESSLTTKKRFSFKAAQFKEYPNAMVYLTCVLSAEEGV